MTDLSCDYNFGCHKKILARLAAVNDRAFPGYGQDSLSAEAAERIRSAFHCPDADIYFLAGGTQTNRSVISFLLHPWEGVVAPDSGHISVHEAGAIEASGHKVLAVPNRNGRLEPEALRTFLVNFYGDGNHEHMVYPGMVYISFPTEYGSLYSLAELKELSAVCRNYELPLFIDGARLGYGLMSPKSDVSPEALAETADVFTVGGTKTGALFGEAVVFKRKQPRFLTHIKQNGALLAKGWLAGAQFLELFTDDLYFSISRQVMERADLLCRCLEQKGCRFYLPFETNQIFLVMENRVLEKLQGALKWSFWEKADSTSSVIRLAAGFATSEEDILKTADLIGRAMEY